jgi:hypothetical protein
MEGRLKTLKISRCHVPLSRKIRIGRGKRDEIVGKNYIERRDEQKERNQVAKSHRSRIAFPYMSKKKKSKKPEYSIMPFPWGAVKWKFQVYFLT